MTVTLATTLRRQGLYTTTPKPIRAALERRILVGTALNSRIKRQAEDAVRILNAVDCIPMLLKGALHLFEAPSDNLGNRFMRDLDVMVPEDKIDLCVNALQNSGYLPEGIDESWTYHYRPMRHPDHIVAIELHTRPGEQRNFIRNEDAWRESVSIESNDLQMVALGANHRLAHNVFHTEVQDSGFLCGSIALRQLYDLATICSRFEKAIDWQSVLARMERHGMGALCRARIHMAVELLGAPPPPAIPVDGLRSRFHLTRCLAQLRRPEFGSWLQRIVTTTGRVLKRHHIDLIYECGTTGFRLQAHRLMHLWRLLRRHRHDLKRRINMYGQRV